MRPLSRGAGIVWCRFGRPRRSFSGRVFQPRRGRHRFGTLNIDPDPTHAIDENTIKRNMKTIHTTIVQDHLSNRPINKLLNRPPPDIDKKEETLPHSTRRKLSQLRTNKSPLLMTYLHKIDPANHPAANCPLCNDPNHDSLHLFNCPDIPTTLTVWDLWTDPVGVAALLDVWGEKLGGPRAGV